MIPPPLSKHVPFIILLLALLIFGLSTFRDFGLSWDEPLFYDYGEALGYAYTPANWFSPDFDLSKSYGSSGDDHKTRGPAYLLLARTPVHLLESLGVDEASAWHLVNFLTFLLGVWFIYRLSLRWMGEWAAFGAAALFSTQPLLLGHAFINPKDMPFLVFFTGALLFGFEMVDALNDKTKNVKCKIWKVVVAAFFLGIATSIRVLAPLAGILVVIYAIIRQLSAINHKPSSINHPPLTIFILVYALLSLLFILASWPYLWESPFNNFFQVFLFMSDNPTGLQVLFGGGIYRAYELPRRYLPTLLGITLTEPVWPLFIIGFGVSIWKLVVSILRRSSSLKGISRPAAYSTTANINLDPFSTDHGLLLTAFLIPFLYVILRKPPMYDGFRHFLFILPPIFVTCGLGLEAILRWIGTERGLQSAQADWKSAILPSGRLQLWLRAVSIIVLILPGIISAAQLHPYEYTYYNSLVGGTGGAFRVYETDYWLTCYKEAVEQIHPERRMNLFVRREPYIAARYASADVVVRDYRAEFSQIASGDLVLVNTRTNEDRKTVHDAPTVIEVGRGGATFCVVKQVP
ncbi:MAG: ArnT family glycosyltransferase [Chloroflexota bacterium]